MDTVRLISFPQRRSGVRVVGGGAEDQFRSSFFCKRANFIYDFFKPLTRGASAVKLAPGKHRKEDRWEEGTADFIFELGEDGAVEFPAGGGDCCVGDVGG